MYRDRQRNKIRGKEEALELYVVVMYLGIVKILHLLFQKEKFKGLKKKPGKFYYRYCQGVHFKHWGRRKEDILKKNCLKNEIGERLRDRTDIFMVKEK